MRLNLWTLGILVCLICWMAFSAAHSPMNCFRWAGMAITFLSVTLLGIARLQLGRSFSIRAQAHRLVTTGMYRYLRHPIYVFGGMAIVGLTLYVERPWLLLVVPILAPMQYMRSRREEELLWKEFGEDYERYRARTWF